MRTLLFLVAGLACLGVGVAQTTGGKAIGKPLPQAKTAHARKAANPPRPPLPIEMPKNAQVTMDVDVKDAEILTLVNQLAGASAKPAATLGTKESMAELFGNIHHVHFINYVLPEQQVSGAVASHEAAFRTLGMHRILFVANGETSFVLMGISGGKGMALAAGNGEQVSVLRTDGYPAFDKLGRILAMLVGMALVAEPPEWLNIDPNARISAPGKAPGHKAPPHKPVRKVRARKHVKK